MKSATENIVKTLKNKKVLFLENDNELYHGLEVFEAILKENKIDYLTLFEVGEKPIEEIKGIIREFDAIVFQTQWVYEISKKIAEFMYALTDKKIVIEVYISEPTWFHKPDSAHDVYIFQQRRELFEDDDHKFYKLSSRPYWEYKNNFNK